MAGFSEDYVLEFAVELARAEETFVLERAGKTPVQRKVDRTVVTAVDLVIQQRMIEKIRKQFPQHAIEAEEATDFSVPAQHDENAYCWVIDPLDGTRNFATGFPCFCTSIAVIRAGEPIIGAVYEYNTKAIYTAVRGCGAALNGVRLHLAQPKTTEDVLVGVASTKDALTVEVIQAWAGTKGIILRNVGSMAMHLVMIATGALAGVFCQQCKVWDIAAAMLIAGEAGAVVTDPHGRPRSPLPDVPHGTDTPVLAGAPFFHKRLLESIQGMNFQTE